MADPTRFSETEMLAHCGRALRKIDHGDRRGTFMVTHDEIEAMAALIDSIGLGHLSAVFASSFMHVMLWRLKRQA